MSPYDIDREHIVWETESVPSKPCGFEWMKSIKLAGYMRRSGNKLCTHIPIMSFLTVVLIFYYTNSNDRLPQDTALYPAAHMTRLRRQLVEREYISRPSEICREVWTPSQEGFPSDKGIWLLGTGILWQASVTGAKFARIGLRVVTTRCDKGYALIWVRNKTSIDYITSSNENKHMLIEGENALCVQRAIAENSDGEYLGSCE
jgi:hypothetical protein